MISFAIVLVNYQGSIDTISCVDSIIMEISNCYEIDIYIIDNNSHINGYNELYESFRTQFELISFDSNSTIFLHEKGLLYLYRYESNIGFGRGNNYLINIIKAEGKHDFMVLLNNDTIVEELFFSKIVSFYGNKNGNVASSVKSISYFNSSIDSEGFGYVDFLTGKVSHIEKYKYLYLVGSCIILNNIQNVPYFDPNFFLYFEDADYSNILRKNNYELLYDENNQIKHKINASTKFNKSIEFIKKESMMYFLKKNATRIQFNIFLILRISYYIVTFNFKMLIVFMKIAYGKC